MVFIATWNIVVRTRNFRRNRPAPTPRWRFCGLQPTRNKNLKLLWLHRTTIHSQRTPWSCSSKLLAMHHCWKVQTLNRFSFHGSDGTSLQKQLLNSPIPQSMLKWKGGKKFQNIFNIWNIGVGETQNEA